MRDYQQELKQRVAFIQEKMAESGAKGLIFGNSGGKDSALVGILCKLACENTLGVIMPCSSKQNYNQDKTDGEKLAEQFGIETRIVDLTAAKQEMLQSISDEPLNKSADVNIAPRLRMITLYAIGAHENRLVVGTGNRSERYMGYFTKWGDGAFDLNPIGDLTVTEIYEFLRFLNAPASIIEKAPSGGLFDGQTDEQEMGVTYASIDRFLMTGEVNDRDGKIINRYHSVSEHKRRMPAIYGEE